MHKKLRCNDKGGFTTHVHSDYAWTERLREHAFHNLKCFHANCTNVTGTDMVGGNNNR